ncbi:MAG: prepilin-type N-terminal cleavage/methylation domain-containing protein [Armatimonadetes bacterium]|nr:prepilin-type N-terminal cleavage/methylation domain-containing protein [Armatimonadota bacterium]
MRPLLSASDLILDSCNCATKAAPSGAAANRWATKKGFTLSELLIASMITSLVLASLCGIYFSTAMEWERQQGESDAILAVSQTCSRLADYISQATGVVVCNRFTTGDALAVNLPADTAYGFYVPIWSGDRVQYRSGTWVLFYLSDATGSYMQPGNILWAGTFNWANFPASLVPDSSWSMYYNTQLGRTAGIKSIRFALDNSGSSPVIIITVTSGYNLAGTERQITQSRTVCLRNAN